MSSKGSNEERKEEDLSNNPFVALFPSVKHAQEYIEATKRVLNESDSQKLGSSTTSSSNSSKPGSKLLQNLAQSKAGNNQDELSQRHKIMNDMLQRIFLFTVDPGKITILYVWFTVLSLSCTDTIKGLSHYFCSYLLCVCQNLSLVFEIDYELAFCNSGDPCLCSVLEVTESA